MGTSTLDQSVTRSSGTLGIWLTNTVPGILMLSPIVVHLAMTGAEPERVKVWAAAILVIAPFVGYVIHQLARLLHEKLDREESPIHRAMADVLGQFALNSKGDLPSVLWSHLLHSGQIEGFRSPLLGNYQRSVDYLYSVTASLYGAGLGLVVHVCVSWLDGLSCDYRTSLVACVPLALASFVLWRRRVGIRDYMYRKEDYAAPPAKEAAADYLCKYAPDLEPTDALTSPEHVDDPSPPGTAGQLADGGRWTKVAAVVSYALVVVVVVGSLVASIAMGNFSWFQRAGSIMTVLPILNILIEAQARERVPITLILNSALSAVGAVLWGYGDMLNCLLR